MTMDWNLILEVLVKISWGILILGGLMLGNILFGVLANIKVFQETFSWKRFFQGILWALIGAAGILIVAMSVALLSQWIIMFDFGDGFNTAVQGLSILALAIILLGGIIYYGKEVFSKLSTLIHADNSPTEIEINIDLDNDAEEEAVADAAAEFEDEAYTEEEETALPPGEITDETFKEENPDAEGKDDIVDDSVEITTEEKKTIPGGATAVKSAIPKVVKKA